MAWQCRFIQRFPKNGDDAINLITKHGDNAAKAIAEHGDNAVELITKHGGNAAKMIANYSDDAVNIINKYGNNAVQAFAKCSNPDTAADAIRLMKNNTKNTVEAIKKYGDNAVEALNNVSKSYQSKCSKYIVDYGDDAVEVLSRYGNEAYNALNKCSDAYKKDAVSIMKNENGIAVRYIKRNGDLGVDSIHKYAEINPETGIKNGWSYVTEPLPDDFTTINKNLAGKTHPDTGVPFEKKSLILGGKETEVVVPRFDSSFEATLPDDLIRATDAKQFSECNAQLQELIERNSELKSKFSDTQIEQIAMGETPKGYTWHHDAEIGKMQLVETSVHETTAHTGGRSIWGGGSDAR